MKTKNPNGQTVSDYIKRTYGTVTRFCDLAKLDEADVRRILKRVPGPALGSLLDQARRWKPTARQPASFEIQDQDLAALRQFILSEYGGSPSKFARDNKFLQASVAQLLAGRRVRRSKIVVQIMQTAKVAGY